MANRLVNALVQKLYYIEEVVISNNKKEYKIMGSTGNVYTVTISKKSECTCPDYKMRRIRCKHICFVLVRILKVNDKYLLLKSFTPDNLVDIFSKASIDRSFVIPDESKKKYDELINKPVVDNDNRKENDDMCPICLDDIVDLNLAYYCKKSCGKNVHIECFDMWAKNKGRVCVFCNTLWKDDKSTYINLA